MKTIKISIGNNIIHEIARQLVEQQVTHKDIVLLPNRRSCRTLVSEMVVLSNKKALMLPNIFTYSDININRHAFLHFCPQLKITPQSATSPMQIKMIVAKVLARLGINISNLDTYQAFLVKFYTFSGQIEKLQNHPQVLEFVMAVNAELQAMGKKLPQQIRCDVVREITNGASSDSMGARIFAVKPSVLPPYIQDLFGWLEPKHFCQVFEIEQNEVNHNRAMLIECHNEAEEAEVVATLIAETLYKGAPATAIICNDRQMVRRLKQKLKRWNIVVDDTTDDFLLDSPLVKLFLLTYQVLTAKEFSAVNVLSLLKHPLSIYKNMEEIDQINIDMFRKPQALPPETVHKLTGLQLWPIRREYNSLTSQLDHHLEMFNQAYIGETNESYQAFVEFIDEFRAAIIDTEIAPKHYFFLLQNLLSNYTYRENTGFITSVVIMTSQEARLHKFDKVIFMGVNEGQYPAIKKEGTLLGFAEEKRLGFNSIEDKINEALSDFAEVMANTDVVVTRCLYHQGKEVLPSRFLEKYKVNVNEGYTTWVDALRRASPLVIERPIIKVEKEHCPVKISVSGIEKLMRDPYAYYAQYILKLTPLDNVGIEVSAREFGIVVHELLQNIDVKSFPKEKYILLAADFLASKYPNNKFMQKEFWQRQFDRIASWVWEYENIKPEGVLKFNEISGEVEINGVKVTAKADRIDVINGSAHITDFKTASVPSMTDIAIGLYPQMPIEALMLAERGFKQINGHIEDISVSYVQLSGRRNVGEEVRVKSCKDTKENLVQLISRFFISERVFFASADEDKSRKTERFKALSRVNEWVERL